MGVRSSVFNVVSIFSKQLDTFSCPYMVSILNNWVLSLYLEALSAELPLFPLIGYGLQDGAGSLVPH